MSVKYDPESKKWVVDDRIEIWEHRYAVLLATIGYLTWQKASQVSVDSEIAKLEAHMKRKPT